MGRTALAVAALVAFGAVSAQAQMQVVSTSPTLNSNAAQNASIAVTFDRAVNPATVTGASFRIFGRVTGGKSGAFVLSNANQTVTVTPSEAFAAGETVLVNLANTIVGADATPLRAAGYAFSFGIVTQPTGLNYEQVQVMSNRGSTPQTRIYGAMAADLDGDQYADLTTVNEVSSDLRVLMNRADGSGQVLPFLQPPVAVGLESSPNEPADFDNDGRIDVAVSSTADSSMWVALGNGNGTFDPAQSIGSGFEPHGLAVLDVDGDADLDIVNSCHSSNDLALTLNNGSGVFGAATFFDGGVNGEYGLASGDVNGDGITDLIVSSTDGEQVRALLGNGNGTFTPAAVQSAGGSAWVVVTGDLNGDGALDVATANSFDGNAGVLLGNGDGTFDPPTTIAIGAHVPSVDLGDLDGNGTTDLVVSSFGGGFWRVFTNDGTGAFTFSQEIPATNNPSCSILIDLDNDGDLDFALTDEIADTVTIMLNAPLAPLTCAPAPLGTCREPFVTGKAKLLLKDPVDDGKDRILWKWLKGSATLFGDFGDPLGADPYALCVYDGGALVGSSVALPSANWDPLPSGYKFKDTAASPYGALKAKLSAGGDGQAKILFLARGTGISMPPVASLTGPLVVQLHYSPVGVCWSATYSAPFLKNDGVTLKDVAD
ncbi:MAG: FG-GAP-like repeat-containing protein [Candidatus Binatia bacterium]